MKKLADIREATILYRVKDIQKPELAKFKSSARMMKLKIDIKQSPRGKETIIRLEGGKKQLRDFDRIARGKSSYGDPSTVKHFDEKSYGAGEEGTDELKKKYKKDTPMESLEENAIPKIKQIVAKKQAMKIDGVMVDMFTASAISQIYDKVNDANKKKMEKMKVTQLANAAMKLMRRNSVSEGLWDNIRAKRARGERMRKKGEKGAPTQDQIKRAQGESVEEATVFKKGKLEVDYDAPASRNQVRITMKGNSPSAIPDRIYMSKAEFTALQKALPKIRLKEEVEENKKNPEMDAELMGLYTKAMKTMPGSPAQKKIIKQINRRRKLLNIGQSWGEGLEEGKRENKKAQIERIKLMRKVKITTVGQKTALADLLSMTSPKVLEGMFKQNPRGFMVMLSKMNTNNKKLSKVDYMVDGQFVTALGNLLTKDQTKELGESLEENMKDKAFRDFRRAGGGRKRGADPADQDMKATDDDRKAASKNIIMQLRRVSDLPRGGKVEFENGKTVNVTKKDAVKIGQFFDRLRKPQDKAKFQAMIYKSPADMKKVLSKLR